MRNGGWVYAKRGGISVERAEDQHIDGPIEFEVGEETDPLLSSVDAPVSVLLRGLTSMYCTGLVDGKFERDPVRRTYSCDASVHIRLLCARESLTSMTAPVMLGARDTGLPGPAGSLARRGRDKL